MAAVAPSSVEQIDQSAVALSRLVRASIEPARIVEQPEPAEVVRQKLVSETPVEDNVQQIGRSALTVSGLVRC